MAVDAWLTDENGTSVKEIMDDRGELARMVAQASSELYPLLSGIDPYADTVFNGLQMARFISEWDQLAGLATSPQQRDVLARVRQLATQVEKNPHLYLRFVGE